MWAVFLSTLQPSLFSINEKSSEECGGGGRRSSIVRYREMYREMHHSPVLLQTVPTVGWINDVLRHYINMSFES